MTLIFVLILWTVLLVIAQELLRSSPPWLFWILFLVVPLLSIPRYIANPFEVGWFPWIKLVTVLVCLNWFAAIRTERLAYLPWVGWSVYLLLSINIVEAILRDEQAGTWANILSGIAGVLVILTLRISEHPVEVSGPRRELLFSPTTRWWILEYTLWNWAFVYLNFPEISGHQLAVLLAAAIPAMWRPARWLQARAITLGISAMSLATFPELVVPAMDTATWSTPTRRMIVAIVSVSLAISYTIRLAHRSRRPQPVDSAKDLINSAS